MGSMEIEDKKTLSQKVYEKLKTLILTGELESGSKLTETHIAKLFGVSPTPVREAFKKLSSDSLIEVNSWKGRVVKGVSKKDLFDIYQCRATLEGLAGSLSCKNITEDDIALLDDMIERSKATEDIKLLIELNTEFHAEIVRISGNLKLKYFLDEMMTVVIYARTIYNRYMMENEDILREHIEILAALKERDADKVSSLLKSHIENSYHIIEENF